MVRTGKLKSGIKGKLKRWPKGQSSSSNPTLTKHREKAKSKFFHMHQTSKSNKGLTLEALKIHDEMQENQTSLPMEGEGSEGGQTFGTFLSGLSDCSNITFKKIQRYWQNNSAKHKEVCAVIAAITEVIRQQGGSESDTTYFAALVTALESVEDVESVAAVAYLLSMTCKRVPEAVLRAKFSEVSKLLVETLGKFSNESPTALLRSLLVCIATLLRNQSYETWSHSSTMNIYQTLLAYSFHAKPKVRKAAQNGVCAVLKASSFMLSEAPPSHHPAAANTAKYCVQFIEKSGSASGESSSTCHAVSLLKDVLHCFPSAALKSCCETILKLMTLSQPIVKSVCMEALCTMFQNRPKPELLSADVNAQLMTALYDYQPAVTDIQLLGAWLMVMGEAIRNLTALYSACKEQKKGNIERLALAHVTKLCKTCMKLMESAVGKSRLSIFHAIQKTIESLKMLEGNSSSNEYDTAVKDIFKCLELGLQYKFHAMWEMVFKIFQTAYQLLASEKYFDSIRSSITSMANLRNTPLFPHKGSLDAALGMAVVAIGPKLLLEAVPLLVDGTESDYDFPRSWLLPFLKDHVTNTEMSFFTSYFLGLAAKLRLKSIQLKSSGEASAASTYDTLQYQIWSLLPNFCDGAKDVATAFPTLARTLGTAITEREDLRPIAMQALRTLIRKCTKDEDRKTLARFSKNYIPILFNLYTTLPPVDDDVDMDGDGTTQNDNVDLNKKKSPDRLAALETIRLYLPLAEKKLVCGYFTKAQQRVFDGVDENDATRLALLDLLICMAAHINKDTLNRVYQDVKPMLNSPNHSMQKKAYRLLEEVCGSNSNDCREFVNEKLNEIKALLTDGLVASSPSSKGPRLKCMERVLKILSTNDQYSAQECIEFMRDLIPEVIMCTRERKRARGAAFNTLVAAGNTYCEIAARISDGSSDKIDMEKKALADYFEICFAGLGGEPITITASICALSRLVYEFKDKLSSDLLNTCINNICVLLGTNTREVCKAALGFVTVLLTVLDRATLAQHLNDILGALFEWKSETRRHFRFRVKKMLERFVKKFGYETIYSMVPPDHRKQLANLKKTRERQKRQLKERRTKKGDKDSESDAEETATKKTESIEELLADSDSGDEDENKNPKMAKKKPGSAWLKDSQDEPMDLLDHSVSQNIIATNPHGGKKRSKKEDAFKSAPDGRLIIDDEESGKEDVDEVLGSLGIKKSANDEATSTNRKRKVTFAEDKDSDDETEPKYKPGGKGIHRNMDNIYKAKKAKGDIKKKGMPDPYAYIPLNKSVLNKRKRKKLAGQFEGLVRAAKHGAAKGKKSKTKKRP